MKKEIIHLISGPRNISTALMYSFGNRKDMTVIDEPFYAHYLISHPDIIHPGKEDTLRSQDNSFETVRGQLLSRSFLTPYYFVKNMAHHMDGVDWSFMHDLKNVFLVRNPEQLIASFAAVIPNPTMLDIGLKLEWEIYDYLSTLGKACVVIDSGEILENPEAALGLLCAKLDIPMDSNMLSWTAGPRKEDGTWAKYWYKNVHKSTSFARQKTSQRIFPERLRPLLDEANKYYDLLCAHSLKV